MSMAAAEKTLRPKADVATLAAPTRDIHRLREHGLAEAEVATAG